MFDYLNPGGRLLQYSMMSILSFWPIPSQGLSR